MLALRFLLGNNPIPMSGEPWTIHSDDAYVSRMLDSVGVHQRQALERQARLPREEGASAVDQALRQLAEVDVLDDEDGHLRSLKTLDRTLLADTTMVRWVMAQAEPTRAAVLGIPSMLAPKAQRRAVRGLAQSIVEGRLDDAAAVAEAVRALGIRDTVVSIMTGLVHLWRDEPEAMLESFRLAVDMAPTQPQGAVVRVLATEMMARAWFTVGECARAMQEQVVALEARRGAGMPDGAARYRLAVYATGAGRYATAIRGMAGLITEEPRFLLVALSDADLAPIREGLRRGLGSFVDKAVDDATRRVNRLRIKYDLMTMQEPEHTDRELRLFAESLEEIEAVVGCNAIESHIRVLREIGGMENRLSAINDLEDARIHTEEIERALERARGELEVTVDTLDKPPPTPWPRTAGYILFATCLVTIARVGLHLSVWSTPELRANASTLATVVLTAMVPTSIVVTMLGAAWTLRQVSEDRRPAVLEAEFEERKALVQELELQAGQLRREVGALTEQVTLHRAA